MELSIHTSTYVVTDYINERSLSEWVKPPKSISAVATIKIKNRDYKACSLKSTIAFNS